MMQARQFNMLALSAVISLIAAGVVHSAYNSWSDEKVTGQRLFPSLERQADKTGQIAIQKGEEKLTLQKSADGKTWSIVERAGYPVDPQKVRKLVVSLGQAELIEKKTRDEKRHAQLDLGDPTAKDADAKLIRLADAGNQTIAEVVIGRERRAAFGAGKSGTYLRRPGDPQTWLAKLEVDAPTSVSDWVEPAFFSIDDTKIKSLVVTEGPKLVYKLVPSGEEKRTYKFVDIPQGRKINPKIKSGEFITGIRTLEMTDVRKAGDADAKPDMTAEITMEDGAKYRVGLKREDKKSWITVALAADGKDAAAAKAFREATKGWAYEVAGWRADQTFRRAEEVYETVKVEPPKMSLPPKTEGSKVPAPKDAAPAAAPGSTTDDGKTTAPEPANADVQKK